MAINYVDVLLYFLQKTQSKNNNLNTQNIKILFCLQFLLTNVNLSYLSFLAFNTSNLLHHDFTYRTYVFL